MGRALHTYMHTYIAHCNVYITNIRTVIFRFTLITASGPVLVTLMVSDSCGGRSLLLCDRAWAGHGPQATGRIRSSILSRPLNPERIHVLLT